MEDTDLVAAASQDNDVLSPKLAAAMVGCSSPTCGLPRDRLVRGGGNMGNRLLDSVDLSSGPRRLFKIRVFIKLLDKSCRTVLHNTAQPAQYSNVATHTR